jgi:hypothetical protein
MNKLIPTIALTSIVFAPFSLVAVASNASAHHSSSHISTIAIATTIQKKTVKAKSKKTPIKKAPSDAMGKPDATAAPGDVMKKDTPTPGSSLPGSPANSGTPATGGNTTLPSGKNKLPGADATKTPLPSSVPGASTTPDPSNLPGTAAPGTLPTTPSGAPK